MINRITYSVVFPSNGLALKGEFKPQPGITAVIGPNESGKTFTTIELTRYLLFGKPALRGPAVDYKKLEVEGDFTIKGHRYVVSRTSKKETIKDAVGAILAVGASEVTNKVTELLGYGLTVFDIANASVQKKADLFGTLTAGDRKKLVDQVVGLAAQEKVEKDLRSEATVLQREADALTRQLRAPVEPDKPVGYIHSDTLREEYEKAKDLADKANIIRRKMRPTSASVEPTFPRLSPSDLSDLNDAQDEYYINNRERGRLQMIIDQAQPVEYTEAQLEAAAERLALAEIVAAQVECPKCGNEFTPGHGHVTLPDGPDLTRVEIRQGMAAIADAATVADARRALEALPVLTDLSEPLTEARENREKWLQYDMAMSNHIVQEAVNEQAKLDLAALGDVADDAELEYMRERIYKSQGYERDADRYTTDKAAFDKLSAEIVDLQRRSTAFKDGLDKLVTARASIKSYLAPAISAAASNLMHTMTKGKHSSVTVDEDMEITIGTQSIDTLSGGAATVANIALRLALGQVLVAETFPVFLGDEMDSDADTDRRETVADALASLVAKGLLKQVILVTHRGVDIADHVHDLGITE